MAGIDRCRFFIGVLFKKNIKNLRKNFLPVAFRANISCTCSDAFRPLGVAVLTDYDYVRIGLGLYRNLGGPFAV